MFDNSKGHAARRSLVQLLVEVIASHRGEIAPQGSGALQALEIGSRVRIWIEPTQMSGSRCEVLRECSRTMVPVGS